MTAYIRKITKFPQEKELQRHQLQLLAWISNNGVRHFTTSCWIYSRRWPRSRGRRRLTAGSVATAVFTSSPTGVASSCTYTCPLKSATVAATMKLNAIQSTDRPLVVRPPGRRYILIVVRRPSAGYSFSATCWRSTTNQFSIFHFSNDAGAIASTASYCRPIGYRHKNVFNWWTPCRNIHICCQNETTQRFSLNRCYLFS